MVRVPAEAAETLDDARGDVGGRGIDHGIVIGKGNVAEKLAVVVAVESSPATVAILHAEKPLNAAAHGGSHARTIGVLHALEGHQHKRGVVHVWIKIIAKLKGPAARLGVLVLDLPVAGAKYLFRENPIRGLDEGRMVRGKARLFKRD